MATGTVSTSASTAGPRKAFGRSSFTHCKTRIWSGSWSTRRRFARISAQPDKKTTAEAEALGRSRGGFTTKVHAAVDALGNPLRFILTPGQRVDITQAEALVAGFEPEVVVGDKGYDSDAFVAQIEAMEAEAVIPSRRNRTKPREIDENLYADRNKIERFFSRIKH